MMWTIQLDYGISLGTYHGVTLTDDASVWDTTPGTFKHLLEEARELVPWIHRFQFAHWCWQGGETAEDIYQEACVKLSSNTLSPRLLSVFLECLAERQERNDKPRKPPRETSGYVYLLKGGEYYKIGLSKNADRRIEEISPKLPFETELICTITTEDMYELEAFLHEMFADKRANGEWFELDEADVETIRGLADE